ncbi:MAG: methyltransferase domain-containing protein [Magnetococcus sp. YQC-5]
MTTVRFETEFRYTDRHTKGEYVWRKYHPILRGRVLDVGADECPLRAFLPAETEYIGIGLGGCPDVEVNLEQQKIPFPDHDFDCVLCLDVLEHLENIHAVLDDLCRVSRRYVIISLPNAWADFHNMLCLREYAPGRPMKFYNLPLDPPQDRHKWFFSLDEAKRFIEYRARRNGMRVIQMDSESHENDSRHVDGWGWRGWLRRRARKWLYRKDLSYDNLFVMGIWAVLEKSGSQGGIDESQKMTDPVQGHDERS